MLELFTIWSLHKIPQQTLHRWLSMLYQELLKVVDIQFSWNNLNTTITIESLTIEYTYLLSIPIFPVQVEGAQCSPDAEPEYEFIFDDDDDDDDSEETPDDEEESESESSYDPDSAAAGTITGAMDRQAVSTVDSIDLTRCGDGLTCSDEGLCVPATGNKMRHCRFVIPLSWDYVSYGFGIFSHHSLPSFSPPLPSPRSL